jgi:hypothetical protein
VVSIKSLFATDVDMMIKCDTPIASVEVLQVTGLPVQVIPLKVPSPASHLPFWLKSRKNSPEL